MVEDIRGHQMHSEWTEIPDAVAEKLQAFKASGKKILAVGTTTARTLEGRGASGTIIPGRAPVNLFIHPGERYDWKWVDAMLTNFHLPESTLLMMVASRIGDLEFTLHAYQEAIQARYRFYSYGDAMLILDR
jgi:S-adenosylmethionine:tRNA ribosyltransferase-isomerase